MSLKIPLKVNKQWILNAILDEVCLLIESGNMNMPEHRFVEICFFLHMDKNNFNRSGLVVK